LTANAFLGGSGNISKLPISNKLPNFAHSKGLLIKTWALLKCRKIVIKAGPSNLDLIPLKFHVKEVGADTKLIQKRHHYEGIQYLPFQLQGLQHEL